MRAGGEPATGPACRDRASVGQERWAEPAGEHHPAEPPLVLRPGLGRAGGAVDGKRRLILAITHISDQPQGPL